MHITVIEETDLGAWDHYLNLFSASPLISASWLEAFRTPRQIPRYFRFVAENTTVGILAGLLLEPANPLVKKFNRPLFCYSGPAVARADLEIAKACIVNFIAYARRNGYTGLSIKGVDYPYVYDWDILPYRNDSGEFIIDLRSAWPEIQKKMQRSRKFEVRKAMRHGVTVHEGRAPELVQTLSALIGETEAIRMSKGYANYIKFALPYFDETVIAKLLQNQVARIFYAQHENHILCTLLVIAHTKRACALTIGTSQKGYELKANALVWHHVIAKLKEEGNESLNLGCAAKDNVKLVFQKTSWGAERYACVEGTSGFLQSPLWNLLYQLYARKFSFETIRKILGR